MKRTRPSHTSVWNQKIKLKKKRSINIIFEHLSFRNQGRTRFSITSFHHFSSMNARFCRHHRRRQRRHRGRHHHRYRFVLFQHFHSIPKRESNRKFDIALLLTNSKNFPIDKRLTAILNFSILFSLEFNAKNNLLRIISVVFFFFNFWNAIHFSLNLTNDLSV